MNWNSHTKKMNWRKSKIHFSNSIGRKSMIELVIEQSGAHKRKQVWHKIRISNSWWQVHYWELLVLKASWNSSFFCKCWSPFDFVFQDYSPGTELTKVFCVQYYCSIAKLHQTLLFGRVQLKSVEFDGNFIRFSLVWYAMLYTEPSLIAVLWL